MHQRWILVCLSLGFLSLFTINWLIKTPTDRSFDQELELTLKAGCGELSEAEKQKLLRENHPLLAQVGHPTVLPLLQHFSKLPSDVHRTLKEKSFVKWRMADRDQETRVLHGDMVEFVLRDQLGITTSEPGGTAKILSDAEVGFAIVELEQAQEKFVSWFAFGSSLPTPMWITIVNSDAAKLPGYAHAHAQRLPLLRGLKSQNVPPKLGSIGRPAQVGLLTSSPISGESSGRALPLRLVDSSLANLELNHHNPAASRLRLV